ncbi:hypothetical protein WCN79_19870 [Xanthomonas axonopodis pv. vasculorum]|uniref:Membrane protein n=1 Tax=Xanthomonas axonopodis pv. vasculorum TaxID=325777 RepID=A0A098PX44_9XANT|nr:hypothetical protein [Xanthomonas axonopodis]KGE51178.1 membrane protein [Xanthomonas axonopodis pv. vasculorum]PPV10052.1 hypothetical protein XavaCFBP5823_11190 [Xanthomonas axonopodis pv. vasculorum]QKD85662.1 hypothetical protein XAV_03455 [Xanthomonas axonopodis pv. vasculorum]
MNRAAQHNAPGLRDRTLAALTWTVSHPALAAITALAALYALLAVAGGVLTFSPVPFWDMWDGGLGFYVRQMTDISQWWAQHNEHRIVLSRILFFMDYRYFDSNGAVLVVINYLLACSTFGLLAWCAVQCDASRKGDGRLIAAFILCCALLWTQSNNLTWAFQSQFFLANLLPLLALVLLHTSCLTRFRGNTIVFVAALTVAAMAAISMANGVLAGSVVATACLLGRQNWRRNLLAWAVAIAVPALYFHHYTAPARHGSILVSLRTEPLEVIKFFFAYVGSPFAHLDASGSLHLGWAILAGVLLLTAGAILCLRTLLKRRDKVDVDLVVTLFLGYLVASAFATAGSRALFGLDAAVASRYTTPGLLVLGCVLILASRTLFRDRALTTPYQIGLALIALAFLPSQLTATRPQPYLDFERRFAALALELGIKDEKQIGWIFPDAAWAQKIAEPAANMGLGIFAEPGIYDAKLTLGGDYSMPPQQTCSLAGLESETVDGSKNDWMRLKGGLMNSILPQNISTVLLVDSNNTIVGRGLLAEPKQDSPGAPFGAPFKAYLMGRAQSSVYKIVVPGFCTTTVAPKSV